MTKKIKDYLHLYLGCDVMWKDKVYTLEGVDYSWQNPVRLRRGETVTARKPEQIKPILRPLSDMTEEERRNIWQVVFGRKFHENGQTIRYKEKSTTSDPRWVLMSGVERLGIEISGDVWADSDLSIWKFNPNEVTRYLLSRGFDLFNLIEAGLAIDKMKT